MARYWSSVVVGMSRVYSESGGVCTGEWAEACAIQIIQGLVCCAFHSMAAVVISVVR